MGAVVRLAMRARSIVSGRSPYTFDSLTLSFVPPTLGSPTGWPRRSSTRLNAVPGYRVPAPTSTFYYKNKDVPVADIARALRVMFVADGSVRRAGATVRVAVLLIRAEGDDVIWSETYDRPWNDALRVQDDIAGTAAQAITRSIEARANPPRP